MKKYPNQREVLFVVPARSGSKGVKNKNLQLCAGESLLRRAVNLALEIDIDSRVIISTDSEDYIDHVSDLQCSNHFLRPIYLSGSAVGDIEVLTQALHASEILFNECYKCIAMLQPTSPLRKKKDVLESVNAVLKESWEASFTANKVDLKYHPLKSLKVLDDGSSDYYLIEGEKIINRQMLKDTFIRNGACYSITPHCLTTVKSFIGKHSKIIETEPMISIDSNYEIMLCEKIILENNKED